MTIEEGIFYVLAIGAGLGGLGVVVARNVVHSALALILALLSVAGLFLLLSAEFLALVQVLIYGGAVTIILLFAMMLTRVRDMPQALDGPQRPLAAAVAGVFMAVITIAAVATNWAAEAGRRRGGVEDPVENPALVPLRSLGDTLFRDWAVPFEVASLVLVVALVGAIILARGEEGE
ncbi:MAG: NADH-quinone oxidoreductase subunit J [Dehalococcoidia bacterium]